LTAKICVVIPAYNASKTIEDVIKGALQHVDTVIVADDGSTDNTAEIAARTGAHVITITRNRGKGHALRVLFRKSIKDGFTAVITLDADGQHSTDEIPSFINTYRLHPHDIIVGSRMFEKEKIPRARYNSMHIARFYISLAANQFIADTQCGYRLYPLSLLKDMILTTEKYTTETEILIKAGDLGAVIRFIDSKAIYTGGGSYYKPVMDTGAITAYVVTYLIMKWFKEGFMPDKPFTYTAGNIMNLTGKYSITNTLFQTFVVIISIPVCSMYFINFLITSKSGTNNFASLRNNNIKFSKIVRASYMLPFVLLIIIVEKALCTAGLETRYIDGFIARYYPHLWSCSHSTY